MSDGTDAIRIAELLVKAKIPKETATELVGYMDRQKGHLATKQDIEQLDRGQDRLWRATLGGFAIIFTAMITVMLYLHSNTNERLNRMDERLDRMDERLDRMDERLDKTNERLDRIEAEIKEIKEGQVRLEKLILKLPKQRQN